ncbi:hypothetical protein LVD15_17675 [Fulvivirga maritima]|uniref:hypothetical protein n=1 Tax=Fulvivirga maritima TaxID=2904247 RepID=UPI001F2B62AD|nr:hypothetical protein [Fulvivirga maritima]UII25126.1 hypothetical protein LVD15_17675 [Fulvivirga maritima]
MAFQNEILKIPIEKRCVQTRGGSWNLPLEDCYFGVPESELFGWTPLHEIPAHTKGFHFYLGSDGHSLIHEFVKSEYPEQIERLSIGNSSFALGSGLNYEHIAKVLSSAKFPDLKVFQLGVWELYHNAHGSYGNLGDVTEILKSMPNLEVLLLGGAFTLQSPVTLANLKDISVLIDDPITGTNGGSIDDDTFNHLQESFFPELTEAFLDLECDDSNEDYKISKALISGASWPKLQKIEFTGLYNHDEQQKMKNSQFVINNNIKVYFSDLE